MDTSSEDFSEVEDVLGTYKCSYGQCTNRFRKEKHLDMHVFKHTGIKKYKCEIEGCDKSFIIAYHVKRHVDTVHGFVEKTQAKCDFPGCDKVYSSRDNMKKHYRQVHSDPKTHDCPHCEEKFLKKKPLKLHLYTHTGDYPQKCKFCGAGFLNLKELIKHQSVKHKDGGKKRCNGCSLVFENWSSLMAHQKTAHPKTFNCDHCKLVFFSRGKLKIHLTTHQEKDWLQCSDEKCKFTTQNRTTLLGHIRRNHGDKNFKCEECDRRFSKRVQLQNHTKRVHEKKDKGDQVAHRKPRKDLGEKKKATAFILTGMPVDVDLNKALLGDAGDRLQVHYSPPANTSCAAELNSATTDTDSDAGTVRKTTLAF